jgi:hypothetical protein
MDLNSPGPFFQYISLKNKITGFIKFIVAFGLSFVYASA